MRTVGYGYDLHNFADRIGDIVTRGMRRLRIDINSKEAERKTGEHTQDRRRITDPHEIAESIVRRMAQNPISVSVRRQSNGGRAWYICVYSRTEDGRKRIISYSTHSADKAVADSVLSIIQSKIQ